MAVSRLKVLETIWKAMLAIFAILGGISSMQSLGILQQVSFTIPVLWANISIVSLLALSALILSVGFFLLRKRAIRKILSDTDARWIVLASRQPRTTSSLKKDYETWKQQRHVWVLVPGMLQFDDYLKKLEREGMLRYANDQWQATPRAMDEIRRYHGGV